MRWVMSFGSAAKAIDPPALVEAIREEVLRMVENYAAGPRSERDGEWK